MSQRAAHCTVCAHCRCCLTDKERRRRELRAADDGHEATKDRPPRRLGKGKKGSGGARDYTREEKMTRGSSAEDGEEDGLTDKERRRRELRAADDGHAAT